MKPATSNQAQLLRLVDEEEQMSVVLLLAEDSPDLDLFYRCQFRALVGNSGQLIQENFSLEPGTMITKAMGLWELQRSTECLELLANTRFADKSAPELGLLCQGLGALFSGHLHDAKVCFQDLCRSAESERLHFIGAYYACQILLSLKQPDACTNLLSKLNDLEPLGQDDEKICLSLLLGRMCAQAEGDLTIARSYYKKAIKLAATRSWNYYFREALFGLAEIADTAKNSHELHCTLELLNASIIEAEEARLMHRINHRFKDHYAVATAMEFDTANQRIFCKGQWLAFHERPTLFQFLLLLHTREEFVKKQEIAQTLWPQEGYKPRVHDPRIFDIARRARLAIETSTEHPATLLSSRKGYRLASF